MQNKIQMVSWGSPEIVFFLVILLVFQVPVLYAQPILGKESGERETEIGTSAMGLGILAAVAILLVTDVADEVIEKNQRSCLLSGCLLIVFCVAILIVNSVGLNEKQRTSSL